MKKIKTYIFSILLGFLILFGSVYAYNLISNNFGFQYKQTAGINAINYDNYSLNNASNILEEVKSHTGDNGVLIKQVSRYESDYVNNGLRIRITGISSDDGSGFDEWFFSTNRFGRFEIKNGEPLEGYKKTDQPNLGNYCPGENLYYSLKGKIYSYHDTNFGQDGSGRGDWGSMDLNENESFFCPRSKGFKLTFDSEHLGKMEVSTGSIIYEYDVLDPYGNLITINSINAFDNKKVYINGIISHKNIDINSIDYTGEVGNNKGAGVLVTGGKLKNLLFTKKNISKNIEKLTKGKKAINLNNSDTEYDLFPGTQTLDNLNDSRKLFYYNYEGLNQSPASNENNNGVILRLGNNGIGKIPVLSEKTIIIKGGNLYINTNIYNSDKNSLLTIVVTRDKNDMKKGGNIYISPEVTNIDAILISDGSLLSFDIVNNNVLNAIDDTAALRKQLLIFGAISTKNTIGKDISPYGSDAYIKNNGNEMNTFQYNLENLRSFEVEMVTGGISGECSSENEIRSMGTDVGGHYTYMFAGRKQCYIDNPTESNLKGSERISPLLIYYNPILQIKSPEILSTNF